VDWKLTLWSIALFLGSGLLFRAIANATADSPRGITVALQAAALGAIVGAIVVIVKRSD